MTQYIKRFGINTKGIDYVVGDIHGTFTKLQRELTRIGFREDVDRLFCPGDLVDRGTENNAVLEWLDKPWFECTRGNHDQMAIDYVLGKQDQYMYSYNGGDWFIGLSTERQKLIAETFSNLPYLITVETEFGTIGLVHADPVFDDWTKLELRINEEGVQNAAIWSRTTAQGGAMGNIKNIHAVICGHTPMNDPVTRDNIHFIDTGAVFGPTRNFCILRLDTLERV
jgi:serine/threonine protein phosphatase 1